jgi:hypothetical protein
MKNDETALSCGNHDLDEVNARESAVFSAGKFPPGELRWL